MANTGTTDNMNIAGAASGGNAGSNADHADSAWISLMDYANDYGVSLSTLRRHIKAGKIEHKIENGRYLLRSPFAKGIVRPAAASQADLSAARPQSTTSPRPPRRPSPPRKFGSCARACETRRKRSPN